MTAPQKLFRGLGTSTADYILRLERLEQVYGGVDRLRTQQLRKLREIKGTVDQTLEVFQDFTYSLTSYLRNSAPAEADNKVLLDSLKEAMSYPLKLQYNQYLLACYAPDNNRTLAHFLAFRLDSEIKAREGAAAKNKKQVQDHLFVQDHHAMMPTQQEAEASQFTGASNRHKEGKPCICCNAGTHRLQHCEKFYLMVPTERRSFAARNALCFLCLFPGHHNQSCPNKQARCSICGFRHHFLLHLPSDTQHLHGQQEDLIDFDVADTHYLSCGYQQRQETDHSLKLEVALTYFTAILRNPQTGKEVKVNLLADTGANNNCIEEELANELGLSGTKEPYHVQVGGGKVNSYSSFAAEVEIQGLQSDALPYLIRLQVYKQPCGHLERVDWSTAKDKWDHLRRLDLPAAAERNVQGIIGTGDFFLLAPLEPAICKGRHDPIAYFTRLGWMVGGQVCPRLQHVAHVHALFMNTEPSCCQDTKRALERLWQAESETTVRNLRRMPECATLTDLEKQAEEIFDTTQARLEDGRYEVGLLWKNSAKPPNNFQPALEAFYHLERQMERHPEMNKQFVQTITEWINKDIASYISPHSPFIRYVIPTFMVVRLDKVTTSYRLVVDGARKFQGICINDKLLPGPKLIKNIHEVLIRFRQGKHAFTCDVSAMYLNVRVPEDDRRYLCIFYRPTPAHPLQVVQLHSHPFGLSSSPYVAMRTVQLHSQLRQTQFPLAADAVQDSVIVDDFIVSGDDVEQLANTRVQLETLLGEIGMGLHKMTANHATILDGVAVEKIARSKTLGEDDVVDIHSQLPTVKALGIVWNAQNDNLAIQFRPKHTESDLTLRKVVSDGGRLYDLLGLGLPIAMTSRILQQWCWAASDHWDASLPSHLQDKWKAWANNTQHIERIQIPRAVKKRDKAVNRQRLLIFADASTEAQAAVAYVQTLYQDGELEARLLTARGKVTSLKKQESIPRLECLAASMGAELAAKLNAALQWDPEDTLYFSDSTTTLWWIRTTKPLKVFVANRVCTILDSSEVKQWKYVNTKENPADIPTRTCSLRAWAKNALWWWGPKFLTLPDHKWPAQPQVTETAEGAAETRSIEGLMSKLHLQTPAPGTECTSALPEKGMGKV